MQKLILVVLLVCLLIHAKSQVLVESVGFEGLNRTKVSYLETFIKTKSGQPLDSVVLTRDAQILTNLEVMASVSFRVENTGNNVDVIFECKELFTLIPIFNFGTIEENYWVLLGASDVNFLGKGHKVYGYYQYYDRHSAAIHSTFDWIKGSDWGFNLNFIKWSTLEPLYFDAGEVQYNYDNYTATAEGIYHFDFFSKIMFGGGVFKERYEAQTLIVPGAPALADKNKTIFKAIWDINKVNSNYFYQAGWANRLTTEAVYSLDGDPSFYIMLNDLRWHKRIGNRGNFASRSRFGISTNQKTPFAPFVLDSYMNIRGVGNRVDRGTGSIVVNLEYRHALIELDKYAFQGVAFADMGTWRKPGGQLGDFANLNNQQYFVGLGGRFIHKKIYNAIFRIDYGVNLKRAPSGGLVLGVGQYF